SCQPSSDHVPGWKQPDIGEQSVVVDVVERSGQVGIENPESPGFPAPQRGKDRCYCVVTGTAWSKPIGSGFEPGLPLGFQRVTYPGLLSTVSDDRNSESA